MAKEGGKEEDRLCQVSDSEMSNSDNEMPLALVERTHPCSTQKGALKQCPVKEGDNLKNEVNMDNPEDNGNNNKVSVADNIAPVRTQPTCTSFSIADILDPKKFTGHPSKDSVCHIDMDERSDSDCSDLDNIGRFLHNLYIISTLITKISSF